MNNSHTPVVLFIYKRAQNLAAIVAVLRRLKITTIYIVADGPVNPDEVPVVVSTRGELELLIDWPCKVYKNYAKENLGLKERFRTGINWVFRTTDKAIFIEDDCLPDPTFFRFCDELLEKYKDDDRIFSISGNNFQFGKECTRDSYYFSRYPHIWGWATWKRAWDHYDADISDWSERGETSWLLDVTGGLLISKFWKYIFDRLFSGQINTWDYQLTYASFKNNGLNIIPGQNLVTNVGYGQDSTNIKKRNKTIGVPAVPMHFPMVHPANFAANNIADQRINNLVFLNPIGKVSLFIKTVLGII